MASFDTSKIVSDIKSGKIKSKEPPKYILKSNNRGRKVKTLNPRWTAWKKGEKNRQIDKDVETYVKKRKVPINRDLTIDNSKKKKVDKKKTNNTQQTNTPTTTVDKTKSDNKTNGTTNGTSESKTKKKNDSLKIKKGSARNFIKTKKGFARRGTPMAKRAEERERKRKALGAKGYMKR